MSVSPEIPYAYRPSVSKVGRVWETAHPFRTPFVGFLLSRLASRACATARSPDLLDTRRVFKDLQTAQEALDEWVEYYNTQRPHRSLDDVAPASRFKVGDTQLREPERNGDYWVSRKVTSNGIVCVGYQKVNVGQRNAGSACDILVKDGLLQFWVGSQLVKSEVRATKGVIRKKNAEGQAPRR